MLRGGFTDQVVSTGSDLQFVLQIAEAVLYGPRSAGWAKPKIGIGADVNRDMRDRPDLTPEGPDILESTITPKAGMPASVPVPHSRWNDLPEAELTARGYRSGSTGCRPPLWRPPKG